MHLKCTFTGMKLSTFTDYSLRLLMYLATEPQRRTTIAEVAAAYDISAHHLTKVAHGLGRDGWLANVRGHGGGLALAMPARQIVVGQVVRRTERASAAVGGSAERALTCLAGDAAQCAIAPVCRLRGALDEALQAFYRVLDRYTLADLVLQRDALPPLPGIALPAPARASVAARAAS